jgi:outer membrane biogenesis lipoprotein LolB
MRRKTLMLSNFRSISALIVLCVLFISAPLHAERAADVVPKFRLWTVKHQVKVVEHINDWDRIGAAGVIDVQEKICR